MNNEKESSVLKDSLFLATFVLLIASAIIIGSQKNTTAVSNTDSEDVLSNLDSELNATNATSLNKTAVTSILIVEYENASETLINPAVPNYLKCISENECNE